MSNQRTVTVFTSKGKKSKIVTDVAVWGDLEPLVKAEGYDLKNLQPTENITKTTLLNKEAGLPLVDGVLVDFVLFLRPIKTKSGVDYDKMAFKDLRAELNDDDKSVLEEKTGKNWTRVTKQDIIDQLKSRLYVDVDSSMNTAVEVEETGLANAIESVNNTTRVSLLKQVLTGISENSSSTEVIERVDLIKDEVEGLKEAIARELSPESLAEKEAAEAEKARIKAEKEAALKAEQEENERLEKEMRDLSSGF